MIGIPREGFLAFLGQHPHVSLSLLAVLASRLRRLTLLVDDLTGLSVRARLAKCLIGLASAHGHQVGPARIRLGQRISQESMARRVAVTRESINKHLRRLERGGILTKDNGYLVITDLSRLRIEADLANPA